jgi:hypothetical protein
VRVSVWTRLAIMARVLGVSLEVMLAMSASEYEQRRRRLLS